MILFDMFLNAIVLHREQTELSMASNAVQEAKIIAGKVGSETEREGIKL